MPKSKFKQTPAYSVLWGGGCDFIDCSMSILSTGDKGLQFYLSDIAVVSFSK